MGKNASDRPAQTLGEYLRNARDVRRLTLREVEEATEISNAYLSQIEHGKISRPNPNILYKLASVYAVPYETLMEKAGYLVCSPTAQPPAQSRRRGVLPTFAQQDLTQEEEEELLKYLAFLRSRKSEK